MPVWLGVMPAWGTEGYSLHTTLTMFHRWTGSGREVVTVVVDFHLCFPVHFHFFLLLRGEKKSLAHVGGIFPLQQIQKWNLPAPCGKCPAPAAQPRRPVAPSLERRSQGGNPIRTKWSESYIHDSKNGELSLSLPPRSSEYFIPWSFRLTLNTEDDSVHNWLSGQTDTFDRCTPI